MANPVRPKDEIVKENIKKWNIPQPDRDYTVLIHCTTYNHGKYIKDALEGFVMQKCSYSFCAIIIDDCSTDNNAEIIREYTEKYPDIIKPILLGENHMQHGILRDPYFEKWHQAAKYIAECEGDDYWTDPLKLQKQVNFMENHPQCSMVFHNAYYEDSETHFRRGIHKIYDKSRYADMNHIMRDGGFIPTCSIVYRQESFKNYKEFLAGCPAGDLKHQIYAKLQGDVYYINAVMGVYRLVSTSETHQVAKNLDKYVERQNKFINWYKELDQYTDYKYQKEVNESIAFAEARILVAKRHYLKLWKPKYWTFIMYKSVKARIGLVLAMFGLGSISRQMQQILYKKH